MANVPRRRLAASLAGLAAPPFLRPAPASAQPAFPSRPVTVVVPFAPGGSTDVLTRLMAERMTEALGRPVQVENRPGGNTIIGAEAVARAQPDGHTVLMAAGTTLTINPAVYRRLPYRVEDFAPTLTINPAVYRRLPYRVEDFAPIVLASVFPFAVIARNDGPPDIAALIAAARAARGDHLRHQRPDHADQRGHADGAGTPRPEDAGRDLPRRRGAAERLPRGQPRPAGGGGQHGAAGPPQPAGPHPRLDRRGARALHARRPHRRRGRRAGPRGAELVRPAGAGPRPGRGGGAVERRRAPRPAGPAHPRALTEDGQFVKGGTPEEFAAFLRGEAERWRPILGRLEVPQN